MKRIIHPFLCAAAVALATCGCDYENAAVRGTCEYAVSVKCVYAETSGSEAILAMDKRIEDEMGAQERSWTSNWGGSTEQRGLDKADAMARISYAARMVEIQKTVKALRAALDEGAFGDGDKLSRLYEVVLTRDDKRVTEKEFFEFSYPSDKVE